MYKIDHILKTKNSENLKTIFDGFHNTAHLLGQKFVDILGQNT